MEYKLLASPRIRQEAQRCLRAYHEAYQLRHQAAAAGAVSSSSSSSHRPSNAQHGSCWKFYRGELPASPGNEHVDDLLAYGGESSNGRVLPRWCPEELEYRHDYIQWLFPLRERGVNWLAPLLTTAEADEMQRDGLIMARVLQAFRMMLRFYGTDITYTTSLAQEGRLEAQLRRTSNHTEWAARYENLVHHSHNCLRISRILQFLGEVGLEPLKLGWLQYLAQEVMRGSTTAKAPLAACRGSFFFWMEIPFAAEDRARLQKLVEKFVSSVAPPTPATGPVVVVKDLLLPSALDLSRVIREVQPSADAYSASPPSAFDEEGVKGRRRRLE
ncbi:hypothetical protein ABB37_05773 [Leptomonas pyrrhocoris]|uniref:Opioid growth factor receptor (OGFr) conserved domain-containing protein n=1 Tax=Leptomonas pyrrhocoris TaxID=157538 RepID=A0A0M9FZR7_LEPPY|nr:hypothetical protein ABB37_05773 [Leptomonas pyrrhocoris]XP_015657752.1 hypothetical protein ABB37_05773 [Leptomonas pyrrhocoris]KPA79312.1 hypothetical protein ABB37_05773 [Leptomonas pyrrhocoris]KPA79313.1 hypothetical protein ABB37_05773 [Leptomonas pyrrhocoris]|eukprot:XP_015657751.1 hypothetical protein ABB37_05773 [Leptomonas pyrrhocoris]